MRIESKKIRPYYKTRLGKLYHGDCRSILPSISKKVDIVITDIPFNVGIDYDGYNDNLTDLEYKSICFSWFKALKNKAKLNVVKCPPKSIHLVIPSFVKYLDYKTMMFQKNSDKYTNSAVGLSTIVVYLIGGSSSKRGVDFFEAKSTVKKYLREHPVEMSVYPYIWFLKRFFREEDYDSVVALDPFFGSGPLGISCEILGMRWIGIEQSKKYCDIAVRRIEKEINRPKLFYRRSTNSGKLKNKNLTLFG